MPFLSSHPSLLEEVSLPLETSFPRRYWFDHAAFPSALTTWRGLGHQGLQRHIWKGSPADNCYCDTYWASSLRLYLSTQLSDTCGWSYPDTYYLCAGRSGQGPMDQSICWIVGRSDVRWCGNGWRLKKLCFSLSATADEDPPKKTGLFIFRCFWIYRACSPR